MSDLQQLRDLMRRIGEHKLVIREEGETFVLLEIGEFERLLSRRSAVEAAAAPGSDYFEDFEASSLEKPEVKAEPGKTEGLGSEAVIKEPLAKDWIEQEISEIPSARGQDIHYEEPVADSDQGYSEEPA